MSSSQHCARSRYSLTMTISIDSSFGKSFNFCVRTNIEIVTHTKQLIVNACFSCWSQDQIVLNNFLLENTNESSFIQFELINGYHHFGFVRQTRRKTQFFFSWKFIFISVFFGFHVQTKIFCWKTNKFFSHILLLLLVSLALALYWRFFSLIPCKWDQ